MRFLTLRRSVEPSAWYVARSSSRSSAASLLVRILPGIQGVSAISMDVFMFVTAAIVQLEAASLHHPIVGFFANTFSRRSHNPIEVCRQSLVWRKRRTRNDDFAASIEARVEGEGTWAEQGKGNGDSDLEDNGPSSIKWSCAGGEEPRRHSSDTRQCCQSAGKRS